MNPGAAALLDEAEQQVPVFGPAVVLPAGVQGFAAEGGARVDERRFDEARVPALLAGDSLVQPLLQALEAGRVAFEAGRIPRRLYAEASTPMEGVPELT